MSDRLLKTTYRMSKNETALFYFFLESRDNLCFYSTLPFEKGQQWRDIVTYCTESLIDPFKSTIRHMNNSISFEILSEEMV